ncbi:NmrA family NAD(P)-binding protein [Streptomyces sp. SID3343]|nr:NmrA family NAD(P)-binding protein [Streptomyces sp. SID3343]
MFAVTTPFEAGPQAEVAQGRAMLEAAETARGPHLVLASMASADRHTGIPHFESKARVEELLASTGRPATVVAPAYFYDNALGGAVIARGAPELALPAETPLQQVARRDLGALVAAVPADPGRWIGHRVEVAGDAPTPRRMAAAISAAGTPVEYAPVPLARVRAANADMGAMFTFLTETGYSVDIPALRADFPDIGWTTFADWAGKQTWSVRER